jgi:hypothetical protein
MGEWEVFEGKQGGGKAIFWFLVSRGSAPADCGDVAVMKYQCPQFGDENFVHGEGY